MSAYSVRGRTAATVATLNHAIAAIWNPHATQRICVTEIGLTKQGGAGTAGDAIYVTRISARGTAGSTVTPGIAQDHGRSIAPPSGFLMDLAAYSVQPTLDGVGMRGFTLAAVQASGLIIPLPRSIELPAGTGLAICQAAATIMPICEVHFEVED